MTQRSVNGSTWPNNGQEYRIEDLIRQTGPTGAMTFIHPNILKDPYRGSGPSQDNRAVLGKLWGGWPPQKIPAQPEMLVHIRFYLERVGDLEPVEWAHRIVKMLTRWEGNWWVGGGKDKDEQTRVMDLSKEPRIAISVYNETNLWSENGLPGPERQAEVQTPAHYAQMAQRELTVFKEIDRQLPGRECVFVSSPFAPGHDAYADDPESEYSIPEVVALLEYVDLVGLHTYAERNRNPESGPTGKDRFWYALRPFRPVGYRDPSAPGRPRDRGGIVQQRPDLKYFITEWANFACDQAALTALTIADHEGMMTEFAKHSQIVAATSFIWLSGSMHKQNIIQLNKELCDWYATKCGPHYTAGDLPTAKWRWGGKPVPVPPPLPPPPPAPPTPPVTNPWPSHAEWAKIVYLLEEAQRMAEAEGMQRVSDFIGNYYTSLAIKARDAGNG